MTKAIARWNPSFARTTLDRAFESAFNEMLRPITQTEDLRNRAWIPAVDIRETADQLTLTADLPGLSQEDLELTIENNVLTLSGERNFENEESSDEFHRMERSFGRFSRSFTLPRNIKTDAVEAGFENGVLTVTLPKQEQAKARKIKIG
ncbi:MAG: Hsp20/alpha crystallin family protein [Thermoanaerobaculia bacterium]|nr:Hsp20/alpha crystallin family protein [Thermoanaerobaculia bacterium]